MDTVSETTIGDSVMPFEQGYAVCLSPQTQQSLQNLGVGGQKPGFLRKYFVKTINLGEKPGFLVRSAIASGQKPGFLQKSFVPTLNAGKNPVSLFIVHKP
ncbi:hypothetical protein [Microcoleus sp. PH2017_27_LUM_O_A]|uniref:hypothetical protein n=1 Tax=Microcoleus sp. PH2017_27_LUM_O_A TaxID=2798837 RepID=UPI0025D25CC1|nr:hypothetical protein [Microcoleus sp. PH2017_27_LUM_O_A]